MTRRAPDPRYAGVRVDANFFHDDIAPDERLAANRLIELAEASELSIVIPHTVRSELDHPNTAAATRARAARLVHTLDTGMGNRVRLRLVQGVMQGNAQPGKHHKDAAHLYDSALWHCGYFVTCDERILKKQAELRAVVPDLWVVRPTEMIAIYEQRELAD
jgi:predicted nucleic acid-binding protein